MNDSTLKKSTYIWEVKLFREMTEFENLKSELRRYITLNLTVESYVEEEDDGRVFAIPPSFREPRAFDVASSINFREMYRKVKSETFSEMLLRLIGESGEKNSAVYNRANIDRRHFSKIANNENYRPSKETALAFAIALKLNFDETQEFLKTAGYTLTKNNLADVIVNFFIDKKIFDINAVNMALHEYEQPLLGG